ncbi:MAG: IclR family transcriptional regulator [Carbonactinosporaceae bacterium]
MTDTEPTLIGSVQRALRLLEAVSAHEAGAPAKRLARETGLALGTTYHLLRTLTHEGYLDRVGDGHYVLGGRLDTLHASGRNQIVLNRVRPLLMALRDELGAAVDLSLYEGGEIRLLEFLEGPPPMRSNFWVGLHEAGHATATGKCLISALDEPERLDYLDRHPLYELTARTVTRPDYLVSRTAAELRAGLVLDREEYAVGIGCAAVPVTDGQRIGAIGVSLPIHRLGSIEAAAQRVHSTASQVNRALTLTI